MRRNCWTVYEVVDDQGMEAQEEVSNHYSPEAAQRAAERWTAKTGRPTNVDWVLWEITRDGREVIDAEAMVMRGARP